MGLQKQPLVDSTIMISKEQLARAAAEPEKFKLLEKVPFDFMPVSAAGQTFDRMT